MFADTLSAITGGLIGVEVEEVDGIDLSGVSILIRIIMVSYLKDTSDSSVKNN